MIDISEHISAVRRQVGTRTLEAGEARVVTLTRTYGAPPGTYRASFPPAARHIRVPTCVARTYGLRQPARI